MRAQAMMYLTKLSTEPEHLFDEDLAMQHEEMEIMLETYLDDMRGTCNRLHLLIRQVGGRRQADRTSVSVCVASVCVLRVCACCECVRVCPVFACACVRG